MKVAIILTVLAILIALIFAGPILINAWLGWTFGLAPIGYWKLFWGIVLFRCLLTSNSSSK